MTIGFAARATLAVSVMLTAACIKQNEVPSLMGPSEHALSVAISATPDSIGHDGYSQSSIVVTARDHNGEGIPGVTFRLDMSVDGVPADYGRLSARSIVTGNDGRALAVYTAPPAPPPTADSGYCSPAPFSQVLPGPCVNVTATPVGSNFETGSGQSVKIHLVPQGVILPPAETPVAEFVFSPAAPVMAQSVVFDATASCPTPDACLSPDGIVAFDWSFGDGGAASGQVVTHAFTQGGTYAVTLTVTNNRGRRASTTKSISVTGSSAPSAQIVISPTPVTTSTTANLTAVNVTAGTGRTVASFAWNFGDGTSANGQSVTKNWPVAGSYVVVLTLTDDIGQQRQIPLSVTVAP
jgi:PKD repeat protein